MNHLTDLNRPFKLKLGTFIKARVRAVNKLGKGEWSNLNTDQAYPGVGYVKTIPDAPKTAPKRNPDTLTMTSDSISIIMPEI
jgi:hypothetical protein